jgi:hypothetical protein
MRIGITQATSSALVGTECLSDTKVTLKHGGSISKVLVHPVQVLVAALDDAERVP